MKTLLFGGNRPLFACALFLSILFGCRKDSLLPSEEISSAPPVAQLPISVGEAFAFFSNLDLSPANTLDGDGARPMVSISPLWSQAFVGHSPSGREIVTVPLADTSLRALNHGRAGAKLLFSKTGQDSIEAQVLVWVADSAHWAAQSGGLNFNTFTGAYLFFDVGLHFQYGVGVLAGTPVALVDSIGHNGSQGALDREEVPCIPTIDFFKVCEDDTPPPTEQAFTLPAGNCWTTVWIWFDCSQGGGGGDHGGGGGGGNGGNGTGNPPIPLQPSFWTIFSSNVPLQALQTFVQNGGTLPDGITLSDARRLIYLDSIYDLSQGNLQWLSNNTLFLPMICNYVAAHPSPTGDDLKAVAWLIALSQQCGLNFYQQYYLAGHLGEVGEFYNFAAGYNYNAASQTAVKAVIDARIVNSVALPLAVLAQLLELQMLANFDQSQLGWLIDNQEGIASIQQYLAANSNDLALITGVREVINACNVYDKGWEDLALVISPITYSPQDPFQNLSEHLDCFNTSTNQNAEHSVALYVDQPIPGQRNPYKTEPQTGLPLKVDVGHTWLTIKQTIDGQDIVFSFGLYPPGGTLSFLTAPLPTVGEFSHDQNRALDVSMTWNLSPANFDSLITNLKTYTSAPAYKLDDYNCTTFAVKELNKIGLGVPETKGSWGFGIFEGQGLNPGDLGEDLRSLTLGAGMTRDTDGGTSPPSNCN